MQEMQEPWVQSLGWEDPTSSMPGETHGQRAWCATVHGVTKSWTLTEVTDHSVAHSTLTPGMTTK